MQQTRLPACSRRLHMLDVGTLAMTGTYTVTAEIMPVYVRQAAFVLVLFSIRKQKHFEVRNNL